ncbi:MAG TPA: Ger(x)C family spore germination C-terminal domain-containing protein [Limnochordia bacterium]|nr:Ger(x)C family spore germination C-terminal domain-containing protein [Limnochordia bacterium]
MKVERPMHEAKTRSALAAVRKLLTLLALLPVVIAAGGCWDRVDINTLAVVQMISIDRSPSGDIAVGVQIVIPADASSGGAGGAGGGNALRPVYTLTGIGTTLVQSFTSLQAKASRRLFFGNVQVVALGEAYARQGITTTLDAFSRQLQLREAIDVVVTKGPALKLLQARPRLESLPGAALRALIGQKIVPEMSILRLDLQIDKPGVDPAVPWIEINTLTDALDGSQAADPGAKGTSKETEAPAAKEAFRLAGVGLFKGDRLVSFMDLHDARGLGWTLGAVNSAYIQVPWPPPGHPLKPLTPGPPMEQPKPGEGLTGTPAGPGAGQPGSDLVVIRIIRSSTTWEVQGKDDQVSATLKLQGEDDIEENPAGVDVTNPATVRVLEKAAADQVAARVRSTLQIAQQNNTDIFGLGEVIARKDPKTWDRIKDHWSTLFPNVPIHVEAEVFMRRYGFSSRPVPQHTWQILQ